MDTNALLSYSRSRFDHAAAQRVLREKYEAKMIFGYKGGLFRASPELMVFLNLFADQEIVVKDLYDNPIKVHTSELGDLAKQRYQEQMNYWLIEYQQTQNNT